MGRKTQQIPVERGSVEAVTSLDAPLGALTQGGAVISYPEATPGTTPPRTTLAGAAA